MEYKCKNLNLKNPISFWANFPDEERLFFYDSIHDKLIIGAVRLAAVNSDDLQHKFKVTFSSTTFFKTIHDNKWEGLGNETIAFKYYFVREGNESYLYYCDNAINIKEIEIAKIKHSYYKKESDFDKWNDLFEKLKQNINCGNVKKVVASREVEYESSQDFNTESILENLVENNKNSVIFAYNKDGKTFLGSSPEVLVRKSGSQIMSYALAGTIKKTEIDNLAQGKKLLNDKKNNYEHQIVAETIAETMKTISKKVTLEDIELMELKNLYHLRTVIHAEDNSLSIIEWASLLHPTPALGGQPKEKAMEIINKYEKHERGMYAAPLGVIYENGDGIFVVGIRSALIIGKKLYAYVGCGIVEQSICQEEYEETNNKLQTILECL